MNFLRTGISIALATLVAGSVTVGCGGNVQTSGAGGSSGSGASGGGPEAGGSPASGGGPATGGYGGYGASGGYGGYGASGGYAGSAGGTSITPPPPSSAPPNTSGTKTVIAVSHFYLGDTNQQGQPDPNAWKSIGYNLDGLISKPSDVNHCKPQPGANPTYVKTDGNGGIDNSFAENLLPLFESLAADLSGNLNQSISNGTFTELVRLDNLTAVPNQNGVTGALYVGADKGSPALFNGTDVWPVAYNSVSNGNLNDPKVVFPSSYVTNGVWVSGSQQTIVFPLPFLGSTMQIPITRAVVSMQLKGAGTQAAAFNGVIAGIVDTETFITQLQQVAGYFDASLCDGATFDSIAQQIRAASDIMSDGSNGDPTKTCNAISIGIGFDGTGEKLGMVAPPPTPPPNPCAP